jgi:hypothetical protein
MGVRGHVPQPPGIRSSSPFTPRKGQFPDVLSPERKATILLCRRCLHRRLSLRERIFAFPFYGFAALREVLKARKLARPRVTPPHAAQAFVLCPQPDRKEDDLTTERTENTEGMRRVGRALRHGVTSSLVGSGRLSVSVSFSSFRCVRQSSVDLVS